MFEAVELESVLSKEQYKKRRDRLRVQLLEAQRALAGTKLSLVVVIGGVEGAGKGEFSNALTSWIDARGVETHALHDPTDEERQRPPFWRYWRRLPSAGHAAVFLTSWYTDPIVARAMKDLDAAGFDQDMDRVVEFEKMLTNEGTVLVKLWFHLSKKEQKKRLKALEDDRTTRWRVTSRDWKFHDRYARFRKVSEHALLKTGDWRLIDAYDRRHREIAAGEAILAALQEALAAKPWPKPTPDRPKPAPGNVIRKLDLSLKLDEKKADERVAELQGRLGPLTRRLKRDGRSLIVVFEGTDAAGKGGAIRRLIGGMDARLYRVQSVAAPTDEEKAHPYLWRFWRALPRVGHVTIYDRSWYGRVLVERVEGFASKEEWRRAYGEINAFEEQLADAGVIVVKFWLSISAEEQLRRFKDRHATPFKNYKLTADDWRNRDRWDAYEAAACDMIERTSSDHSPWTLVEAENKDWARVKVLGTVVERLKDEL